MAPRYEEAFRTWGQETGVVMHPSLNLFAVNARGIRGVNATTAVAEGEELFRIPEATTIPARIEAQREGELGNFYRKLGKPISNVLRVTLTLLHELHVRGPTSQWWPYLNLLQSSVKPDQVMLWPQHDLEALRGTCLMLRLPLPGSEELQPSETFEELFEREVLPVMAEGGELWPVHLRNQELFLECLSWVMSRGFKGELMFPVDGSCLPAIQAGIGGKPEGPFMLPFFDQVNHSSLPEARNTKLVFEGGVFVVTAKRDITAGEELLQSYGEHGDAELLTTYGFVEGDSRGNPSNCVLVTKGEVMAGCRLALEKGKALNPKRVAFLLQQQVLQPAYRIPASGVLPQSMLTAVQGLLMSDEEFEAFKDSGLVLLGRAIHTRGTLFANLVTAALVMVLNETTRRYGEAPAPAEDPWDRAGLAAKVRAGELAVLREAKSYVITTLAPRVMGGQRRKMPATKKRAAKTAEIVETLTAVDCPAQKCQKVA